MRPGGHRGEAVGGVAVEALGHGHGHPVGRHHHRLAHAGHPVDEAGDEPVDVAGFAAELLHQVSSVGEAGPEAPGASIIRGRALGGLAAGVEAGEHRPDLVGRAGRGGGTAATPAVGPGDGPLGPGGPGHPLDQAGRGDLRARGRQGRPAPTGAAAGRRAVRATEPRRVAGAVASAPGGAGSAGAEQAGVGGLAGPAGGPAGRGAGGRARSGVPSRCDGRRLGVGPGLGRAPPSAGATGRRAPGPGAAARSDRAAAVVTSAPTSACPGGSVGLGPGRCGPGSLVEGGAGGARPRPGWPGRRRGRARRSRSDGGRDRLGPSGSTGSGASSSAGLVVVGGELEWAAGSTTGSAGLGPGVPDQVGARTPASNGVGRSGHGGGPAGVRSSVPGLASVDHERPEGRATMAVTPPAGEGTRRTLMPWRAARRPTTMKPRVRARVRPSSGGWASISLASASWAADMPMPWSVIEIV